MQSEVILESKAISKRFGDFTAVDKVNYQLLRGESAGIIGPNGAGKSTFFNLLTGLFTPTEGQIFLFSQDVTNLRADQRVGLGVVRTFQLVSVFSTLSVLDNLVLSVVRFDPKTSKKSRFILGSAHPSHIIDECLAALDSVGICHLAQEMTAELSYGDKRKLEIAMGLALKPQVLLLDEPLAGLGDGEINEVLKLVRKVQQKLTLVIIEHKISRIVDLVTRLSVMHEGQLIADGTPDEVLQNPTVRQVYWGDKSARKFSGLATKEKAEV
ncbi:MAG: ABC transporter ATP-binding protein [Spirochaetales bacterium]|jgi:branched-chain amino acid transport system ATP-binding protein|nr:ABC transporter ATP-binding protein [Spirochaetales bacterium]